MTYTGSTNNRRATLRRCRENRARYSNDGALPSCFIVLKRLGLFLSLILVPFTFASESYWGSNYTVAIEQAREDDKLIVLLFTGSDWCHWCQKLERELFTDSFVENELSQLAIPIRLDFPRRNKLSPKQSRHNRVLQERFKVESFPTVIVLNSNSEKELLRHNYTSISKKEYIKSLRQLGLNENR